MSTKHISKGGLGFTTCNGCLNYRPHFWHPGGWTGPVFCCACAARMWKLASGNWKDWVVKNHEYLASIGWRGHKAAA